MPPQRVGRPVARSRASRNTRSVFRRPALTATASRRLATVASRRRGTFVVSPAHHARHEKGGRGAASGWVDAGKTSRAKTQSCLEPSGPRRAAIEARRAARPAKPWAVLACADTPGWSRRAFPQRLAGQRNGRFVARDEAHPTRPERRLPFRPGALPGANSAHVLGAE